MKNIKKLLVVVISMLTMVIMGTTALANIYERYTDAEFVKMEIINVIHKGEFAADGKTRIVEYTGNEIRPELDLRMEAKNGDVMFVTTRDNKYWLPKEDDALLKTLFTVRFENNIEPGTAKAIVEYRAQNTPLLIAEKEFIIVPQEYEFAVEKNEAAKKAKEANKKTKQSESTFKKGLVLNKPILSVKKRIITVRWNKATNAKKYEIQYSTNKNFAGAKKRIVSASKNQVKLTKLKKQKRYYVRVRAVSKFNNKTVYGAWKKNSIKTKK